VPELVSRREAGRYAVIIFPHASLHRKEPFAFLLLSVSSEMVRPKFRRAIGGRSVAKAGK